MLVTEKRHIFIEFKRKFKHYISLSRCDINLLVFTETNVVVVVHDDEVRLYL
jgi:hypothetical protein